MCISPNPIFSAALLDSYGAGLYTQFTLNLAGSFTGLLTLLARERTARTEIAASDPGWHDTPKGGVASRVSLVPILVIRRVGGAKLWKT